MFKISTKHLISVYLIVPASILVMMTDLFMFSGAIASYLPRTPEHWMLWTYAFGMPHVIAGILLVADREYMAFYGRKLWLGGAVLLFIPMVITGVFGEKIMQMLFASAIVYHTIAQQFGIAMIIGKIKPSKLTAIQKWSGVFFGWIIYLMIYSQFTLENFFETSRGSLVIAATLCLVVSAGATAILFRSSATKDGKVIMVANGALMCTMLACFDSGLTLLIVLMGRVVHEFSAWIIYYGHDTNRNDGEPKNLAIKSFDWLPLSPGWISIGLACVIGWLITYLINISPPAAYTIMISLSLFHYWSEGFIWKGMAPPKREIAFA